MSESKEYLQKLSKEQLVEIIDGCFDAIIDKEYANRNRVLYTEMTANIPRGDR